MREIRSVVGAFCKIYYAFFWSEANVDKKDKPTNFYWDLFPQSEQVLFSAF